MKTLLSQPKTSQKEIKNLCLFLIQNIPHYSECSTTDKKYIKYLSKSFLVDAVVESIESMHELKSKQIIVNEFISLRHKQIIDTSFLFKIILDNISCIKSDINLKIKMYLENDSDHELVRNIIKHYEEGTERTKRVTFHFLITILNGNYYSKFENKNNFEDKKNVAYKKNIESMENDEDKNNTENYQGKKNIEGKKSIENVEGKRNSENIDVVENSSVNAGNNHRFVNNYLESIVDVLVKSLSTEYKKLKKLSLLYFSNKLDIPFNDNLIKVINFDFIFDELKSNVMDREERVMKLQVLIKNCRGVNIKYLLRIIKDALFVEDDYVNDLLKMIHSLVNEENYKDIVLFIKKEFVDSCFSDKFIIYGMNLLKGVFLTFLSEEEEDNSEYDEIEDEDVNSCKNDISSFNSLVADFILDNALSQFKGVNKNNLDAKIYFAYRQLKKVLVSKKCVDNYELDFIREKATREEKETSRREGQLSYREERKEKKRDRNKIKNMRMKNRNKKGIKFRSKNSKKNKGRLFK